MGLPRLYCTACCVAAVLMATFSVTNGAICEEIRLPMCKWLPYNLTRMPNLLFHSAQTNAKLVLEQYQQLVDTGCSDDLLFFLCAMFAPMCPMGFRQDVIPPCQGVCLRARQGCEPIMNRYNISWPRELSCDNLPKYDRGVCISPESIISTATLGTATPQLPIAAQPPPEQPPLVPESCECPEKRKRKLKTAFTSGEYHYALKAEYRQSEQLADGSRILHVTTRQVFYQRRVKIPRGVARLWVSENCLCSDLKVGRTYLFLGTESRRLNRLIFNSDGFVEKWRNKLEKRLKSWKNKIDKTRYRPRTNTKRGSKQRRHGRRRDRSRDKAKEE